MKRHLLLRILFTLLIFNCAVKPLKATHLMGGELTYQFDGAITGGAFYNVKLIVYRYCDSTIAPTAPLDLTMFLGIYTNDSLNLSNPLNWYSTETLTLIASDFVVSAPGNSNCSFESTACIERGEYTASVLLPDNSTGYHLVVERCCRNGNIVNLSSPGNAGMTFYTFVPPGIINSSPQITDVSVPYMCVGDTVSLINNAFDPDGDSLVYSFVIPFNGYSGPSAPVPDPLIDNNPYALPIPQILYPPGYTASNFLGAGSYANIDPNSGLTKYFFPNQGFYVAAIEIKEFRNGVQISSIRRDLQFISIVCLPNLVPTNAAIGSGTVFTVGEGQSLCFNVTFSDPDGDSLLMMASGPVLNNTIVNPPGVIADAVGDSVVSSFFCWTPNCGTSRPTPYQFSVTATDNGCPPKSTSVIYSIYVTPGPASLTPTVTIAQSPPGIICQGSQITFNAIPSLPGTAPQYFWQLNGIPAGANSDTFTPSSLNNGDIISVMLVSNATCLLNDTAVSPPFIVNINAQPAPAVTITSNPSTVLCPQQICLFTATISNGGATPSYQWNINGNNAGTNAPAFTAANPSGLMAVYVTLTPSTGCPPQQSNVILFNIQPLLHPQIELTADAIDTICPGKPVQFLVTSSLTGNSPIYNWTVNGSPIGVSDSIFTALALNEGDVVNVSVTSTYPCLSPAFTFADPLVYHIFDSLQADLTDGPLEVCSGQPVDLVMTTSGGKSNSYVYTWSAGTSSSNENIFSPYLSGYYYATVADNCFDPIPDSIYIEVLPVPQTDFFWTPDHPSTFDLNVHFVDASINAVSWLWNFGDLTTSIEENPQHMFASGGSYPIELITTNDVGCTDTLYRILEIENFITAYVPNSFTPNGDGKNDLFGLSGFSTGGYSMKIFNRWGQLVFASSGSSDLWNGKSTNGTPAPQGVYSYLISVNNDKRHKPIFGTFTLIR